METHALANLITSHFPELDVEIELADIININTTCDYFHHIEENLIDLINQNGWFVGFRDIFLDKAHISIHPDMGVEMGFPPPVLYHITAEEFLPTIREFGIKLGTGGRHEITYTPRIFVTDDPTHGYGVGFTPDERVAIVAIKTWKLPHLTYYRDPNFWDAGWGAASVIDTIPAEALVVPTTGFLRRHLYKAWDEIPKVRIPKMVALRYWGRLAKRSDTPLRTTIFNFAPVTDWLQKHNLAKTNWGRRLERYFIEGAEQYTPQDHPWRQGAPWWYEHDPKPHGPQEARHNPDRLPMPIFTSRSMTATQQTQRLHSALMSFIKDKHAQVTITGTLRGVKVSSPRSEEGGYVYQIVVADEADYKNVIEDGAYTYYITQHYLNEANQEALFAVFRLLFMGDEYIDRFLQPGPKNLTPPQQRAFTGFEKSYEHGDKAGAIILPTGVGKTIVTAKIINNLYYNYKAIPNRLLFLAGRREILDQAVDSLKKENPWITAKNIGRYYGTRLLKSTLINKKAVFATPHSMQALNFEQLGPDFFDIIVIDEFHHINAPIYEEVVKYFKPRYTLGLTATPFRGDDKNPLAKVANNVLYDEEEWEIDRRQVETIRRPPTMKLSDAISLGYLVPFDVTALIDTSTYYNRANIKIETKDLHKYKFPQRDRFIVHQYKKHLRDLQTVAFCKSRRQAKHMSEVFSNAGVPNAVVLGTDPERDEKLFDFRQRKYPLLIVVDILNEGVDVPAIEGILYLRRIQSMQVILQQIGRGLRRHPGKRTLKIVDLYENVEKLRDFLRKEDIPAGLYVIKTPTAGKVTLGAPPLPLLEGGDVELDIKEVEHKVETSLAKTRTSQLYTFWHDEDFTVPFSWNDAFAGHRKGDLQISYKTAAAARNAVTQMRKIGRTIHVDPDPFITRGGLRRR